MRIERRLLRFITWTNWVLFSVLTVAGFVLAPGPFAWGILGVKGVQPVLQHACLPGWGILAGGLIVTINFHLLYRSLKRTLTPPHIANTRTVLGKYYLRFLASAVIIFVLIADDMVNPLGLIIGLSVVVTELDIKDCYHSRVRRIIFKEAV